MTAEERKEERQEISTTSGDSHAVFPGRSPGNRNAPAPTNVVTLLTLVEIRAMWGAGEDRVYRLVNREEIPTYGRPGKRRYYPQAELERHWGPPTWPAGPLPPMHKPHMRGVNGRNPSGSEYEQLPLATAA